MATTDNSTVWINKNVSLSSSTSSLTVPLPVTGCSTGLGAALCTLISQIPNQRLIATDRNPSTLGYLPSDSHNILTLTLDVTSRSSISAAFSAGLSHFGRIDYVQRRVRDLRRGRRGCESIKGGEKGGMLVQISSLLGRVAAGGQTYYSASKFAIEGFIEALSKEVHPKWNIRFLIAEPGAIKATAFNINILARREIHPAYSDADCPTNKTREWLAKPDLEEDFTPADKMVTTLLNAIEKAGLSLRLPLGQDSWEVMYKDAEERLDALKGCRALS